ncbi:hypothetical protein PC9H_003957 [Pleurotus ostreatus]|uniref:C3H1-type domain-containing protein n=1 Tax=Pleurotus ostreatus TaxID=5322 RepID=A0A8H7DWY6_PLEOS|nr:uncharacterized protein PC9H_003957 [Pleurotus ostreatus]KAF7437123.1 hypothetical protein PC9H_003957 [Pleurotus ostreatus]KAJ8702987.1 hypothetical protein PTI98_001647 [Pleurotus ostreatus]
MHDIVTKSLTTTSNLHPSSDESTPTLTKQRKNTDPRWSQPQELPNINTEVLENWQMRLPNDHTPIQSSAPRRPTPAGGLQKRSYPTRPDSEASIQMDKSAPASNNRWLSNGNGQFVDSDATNWDLSDSLVKLNIGDVSGADDHVHGQMSTPPKSTIGSSAVVPLSETSPLETSSNPSIDSSPHPSDHQISISHSRGSSTDSTVSSSHESTMSGVGNTLLAPAHVSAKSGADTKERPHSFSGGLSAADLRRLQQAGEVDDHFSQQQQWPGAAYRDSGAVNDRQYEQLPYPTLVHPSAINRPQPLQPPFDYQLAQSQDNFASVHNRDDLQIDYALQQRNYNPIQPSVLGGHAAAYAPPRPANLQSLPYRQTHRGFNQPGLMPSPSFPTHTTHLSLGNTQQLYDMMIPPHDPAVARVQQQHNVFRATHHHSASDPSAIRDAAVLAALGGNMQGFPFPAGMAPPATMGMYPNQYYGAQDAYQRNDLATAQALVAARLQSQYTGPYSVLPPAVEPALSSPASPSNASGGPSANNRKLGLYKTELCRSWEEKGSCRYGTKCQFAHGEDEIRLVSRHPKYKTEICRTFWVSGSCPYGKRCCFIHTEVPNNQTGAAGGTPTADSGQQPSRPDGRERSASTNSDPNDGSVSLLARLTAKRSQENNNPSTPVEMNPPSNLQYSRPPTGSLRVDTTQLDGPSLSKQNKSAYPTFTSNGILMPAGDHSGNKSPAPVTAGPDLGRHNLASRLEIVGYPHQLRGGIKAVSNSSSVRRSLGGSDVDGSFSPSPPISGGQSSFGLASAVEPSTGSSHPSRIGGHVRAGSAGNWGVWSSSDLAVGSSRLNEKAWA